MKDGFRSVRQSSGRFNKHFTRVIYGQRKISVLSFGQNLQIALIIFLDKLRAKNVRDIGPGRQSSFSS